MADSKSTVELVFQGIDRTGEATQSALRNARSASEKMRKVTGPVASVTKSALKLESALIASGAAVVGLSTKVAGDFDAAFREISTLIDAPAEDLERFRQALKDYASTSTQTLDSVTGATYDAISAGVDYKDSLEVVRQAEELAVSGKTDLNSTLKVLVSSLNAYGKGMDEAEDFSDILFTTVKQGQTTVSELAQNLSQVTGTAATASIDFDELNSAIAALTATGTPTNRAVTQLNQAINSIIDPTSQAAKLAEELGIEFNGQALEAEGLQGVLQNVAEATGGSQKQMATLFSSTEALQAVLPLTGNAADKFSDNLEAMEGRTDSTSNAFEKMAESTDLSIQKIQNSFRNLLISIGDPMLDEFGGVADGISNIFNTLAGEVENGALSDLNGVIESIFGDIEGTLNQIAQNLPQALAQADFSAFERGIEEVVGAIQDLFGVIDLSTVDGLTSAIETIGGLFEQLGAFTAGALNSLEPMVQTLVDIGSGVKELNTEWTKLAGEVSGFVTQLDSLLPLLETLLSVLIVRQGAGLAGGAAQAAKSIVSMKGALVALGRVSLVAGGAVALWELGDAIHHWYTGVQQAEQAQKNLGKTTERLDKRFREVSENIGYTVTSMEELDKLIDEGKVAYDEASGEYVKASEAMAKSTDQVKDAQSGVAKSVDETGKSMSNAQKESDKYRLKLEELASNEKIKEMEFDMKVELESIEAQKELDKIQSKERIAVIEAQASINTAQIEAQAEQVTSAFESITTGIDSTGNVLGDLIGSFSELDTGIGGDDFSLGFDLRDLMQKENRRRQQEFELQKQLTNSQIDVLKAQKERLQGGDALIKIDGEGLQPHLESFMWEIIRQVQLRVNADGLDMLMGAP